MNWSSAVLSHSMPSTNDRKIPYQINFATNRLAHDPSVNNPSRMIQLIGIFVNLNLYFFFFFQKIRIFNKNFLYLFL